MNTRPHVLVVDDEDLVALVLSVTLEEAGYQVTVCHNGQDALQVEELAAPDLLVTDLRMPIMGGLELIREVRQRRPMARIIVMTGFSEGYPEEEPGRLAVLCKPFQMSTLLGTVNTIMSS